jgi:hypothetical protein
MFGTGQHEQPGLLREERPTDAYDMFARLLSISGDYGSKWEVRAYSGLGRVLLQRANHSKQSNSSGQP